MIYARHLCKSNDNDYVSDEYDMKWVRARRSTAVNGFIGQIVYTPIGTCISSESKYFIRIYILTIWIHNFVRLPLLPPAILAASNPFGFESSNVCYDNLLNEIIGRPCVCVCAANNKLTVNSTNEPCAEGRRFGAGSLENVRTTGICW